ncbi:TadE/TadG family type IV pilus assembly protein [Variovorax ginsengisoli]|uniref:Flp pilus assembly protein TadG n=1 Tax=Variovorax ginsengisoli TaxID=363844 RepID=A0ABT9SEB0_9BURK|nr:TadE/TadG family type IV pilus assembly protein [Variovorax ginsengisoli]MDP9902706.1 Flp pilus assembly protein TadG [Variovorax ginsengisoli]
MSPDRIVRRLRTRQLQGGAYAVEYAIVFPIFFAVLYAIISYGIVFSIRLAMQHAAEEGARASLRYCGTQLACRQTAAEAVARERMSWLAHTTVVAKTCRLGIDCAAESTPTLTCGSVLTQRCQIVVTVDYDYAAHPLAPALPGLGVLLPAQLQGRASMLLVDGKMVGTS